MHPVRNAMRSRAAAAATAELSISAPDA